MAFRFALATLLRLRQSVERQRTLQLQEASLQLSCVKSKLAELERSLSNSAESDASALRAGRTGAEIHFSTVVRLNVEQRRSEFQAELGKVELIHQNALAEYQEAYRNREILEILRARQRRAYQQEELRSQQQELDATYLLQRWHRRGKTS
jgi:flagellar FliJ protein